MVMPILYDISYNPNDSNLKYELLALWLILKINCQTLIFKMDFATYDRTQYLNAKV